MHTDLTNLIVPSPNKKIGQMSGRKVSDKNVGPMNRRSIKHNSAGKLDRDSGNFFKWEPITRDLLFYIPFYF